MLFIEKFIPEILLEDQVEFPFLLDEEIGLAFHLRSSGSYGIGQYNQKASQSKPVPPKTVAYGVAIKKDKYLSRYDLWDAIQGEDSNPQDVAKRIQLLRNSIAIQTEKEIIKTKYKMRPLDAAAGEARELIGGGFYIGPLSEARNESENFLSWNGLKLNKITGYLQLPNGEGIDDLNYSQIKMIARLIGRKGELAEHDQSPESRRTIIRRLRKILGEDSIGTDYALGYHLVNPPARPNTQYYPSTIAMRSV